MYNLITKNTNFKGMRFYYSEYKEYNGRYDFYPIIRKIYVRTVKYYDDGTIELICEGIKIYLDCSKIPNDGAISVQDENVIISTSKQDIAKFWKKCIFHNFPISHFAYNNYDFTTRQHRYKMCMAILKKLT